MKHLIIFIMALSILGCATVPLFNIPYINTDETLKLRIGMTKDEVQLNVGKPIAVLSGYENKIFWLYEVRTYLVPSNEIIIRESVVADPQKNGNVAKNSDLLHRLILTFTDGKLTRWEPFIETPATAK